MAAQEREAKAQGSVAQGPVAHLPHTSYGPCSRGSRADR